jgi:hypothetical protein
MAGEEALEPTAPPVTADPPSVAAAKLLGAVLSECRSDAALTHYADVDLRAIEEIRSKLQLNPADTAAASWARQIAKTWSLRVRGRHIRRVLDLLDQKS